jgi:AP-3 complex subunit beta
VLEVMIRYCRNQFVDPAPGISSLVRLSSKQRRVSAEKGNINNIINNINNSNKRRVVKKAFYSDESDESDDEDDAGNDVIETNSEPENIFNLTNEEGGDGDDLDSDHQLLLKSTLPLLKSRNSGVV